MIRILFFTAIMLFGLQSIYSQKNITDANIVGHVVAGNEHLPFVNISIKGTTIGTLTDRTGHFHLVNVPLGQITVVASFIGYRTSEITVLSERDKTMEVKFELEHDILGLEEVVVSGSRTSQKRTESSLIINTISPKIFARAQAITLSDGLGFSPGVRMETNCSNCGFNQVRMNGMDGAYSQILINSRPIFSGLAGVYGLEMIPTSMIEKVEVIRGGGSALFGSNAIGGTINIQLKDKLSDSYEFGVNTGIVGVGINNSGQPAQDHSINFNSSFVSDDNKSGLSVYGFHRNRQPFDVNNDGFTELTQLRNTTIGSRYFHRFGFRNKIAVDFFNINENRRGGNRFDYPLHEADIAESLKHNIVTGAITYDHFFREYDQLTAYSSGQYVIRDSYYGSGRSLKDYGLTNDFTLNTGIQYKYLAGPAVIIAGIENTSGFLTDNKLGYPDLEAAIIVNDSVISFPRIPNTLTAEQIISTSSVFGQFEKKYNGFKLSLGGRLDNYRINDRISDNETITGNVFSPRIGLLYDLKSYLQLRAGYSRGYRAPQIFNEDLHVEVSGSRKVVFRNSADLKQETSNSFMASLDLNRSIGKTYYEILIEGFHTRLVDPFVNEFGDPDENGLVFYTRKNAGSGAVIEGVNMELNMIPGNAFNLSSGFTVQNSRYEEAHEFNEKRFFRTPGNYGFLTLDWSLPGSFSLAATGNYTGKMLVPYFGPLLDNPEDGELRESNPFFDLGLKLSYNLRFNYSNMEISIGGKNIFNSYQKDFDTGLDKDSGYIYGPGSPRMVYFGIKIGNIF